MKNIIQQIIILSIALLSSCSDYSDQKIVLSGNDKYNLFDSIEIGLGVQGNNELKYEFEIKYRNDIILKDTIRSSFKTNLKTVKIDLKRLEKEVFNFSADLIKNQKIELNILMSNKNKKKLLDSIVTINFSIPPISRPLSIDLPDGNADLVSPLQNTIIKVRNKLPELDESLTYRVAFLSKIIIENQRGFHFLEKYRNLSPFKKGYEINASLVTDTVYKHTFISRYPANNNTYYKDINFEKSIAEYIKTNLDSIKSDWSGEKNNKGFILNDKITSNYNGLIGIYLVNVDKFGQFTYQQIGLYLSDGVSPSFSNSMYCSKPENPKYEGIVCLDSQDFYGWNPYKVPFVGKAYGDIKSIYVDNKKIEFELGEDIYFKKSIYLDGGYNRVPIRIIDSLGNEIESFIPISIEQINNDKINIENNIDINN